MFPPREDILRLAPELILALTGILLMLAEPFVTSGRRAVFQTLAILGTAAALAATIYPAMHPGFAFSGLLRIDGFSVFLHALIEFIALLVVLGSADYLDREHLQQGEFYALVLFGTVGMCVMASAAELMTAFVGLEVSSISTYVLAGYRRDAPRSDEAAMKYFLLGSFATAFFLYGIALVYGATGTTELGHMTIGSLSEAPSLLKIGLAMMLVGLGFKVAAAPFQLWTPDVYEGAPSPVSALMSTGPKAAAFAILLRILATVVVAGPMWFWALWVSAILTMFVGNLAAIAQSNVKRMLAYSAIAHAGYMLVALAAIAASDQIALGVAAVLYYLTAYALMKLGSFVLLAQLGGEGEAHLEMDDFYGLAARRPLVAACFSLFLLSLLGLPATAGFMGKFYIFDAAVASHLVWLAVFLAINTTIGAYYYLRVIVAMYMREPHPGADATAIPLAVTVVLAVAAFGTVYLGIFPGRIMTFASHAAQSLPLH